MMTKIGINVAAIATLCSCAAFAQNGGGTDWFAPTQASPTQQAQPVQQAQPSQPAQSVQPAAQASQQAQPVPPVQAAPPDQPAVPAIIDAKSSMRLGTELSAKALASAPYLITERGVKPGQGRVVRPRNQIVLLRFDRVTVAPAGKMLPFKAGDTVDVFGKARRVRFEGKSARLATRVGRGVVAGYAGKNAVVTLIDLWSGIRGGESIAKSAPFAPFYSGDRLSAPDTKIQASVVLRVEDSVAPYLLQYVIINKGADDGVRLGDFFRVMDRERPNRFSEQLLEGQAVSVAAGSATLVVHKLHKDRLRAGDEAFLSYRAAN